AAQVHRWIARAGISGADVERRRERVVTQVGRVVAGAARPLKRRDAAGPEASGAYIVVDAFHAGDVDGPRVEQRLPASDCRPRIFRRQVGPGIEDVEDRGSEVPV